MPFQNRTALVTGASGNIGLSICRQLAEAGVDVAVTDINGDQAIDLAAALRERGCRARGYRLDVSSAESVGQVVGQLLADGGKIDILVNNAGVWEHTDARGRQALETVPEEQWRRIFEINLFGTIRCLQAVMPGMMARGYGRIINLGSIAGFVGLPGYADYAAAKAGVAMLTKTAAMEVARHGITVNCVSPGMITREPGENAGTWVGRSGVGSEVARAIVFLADDEAGYITGVEMPVDGGRVLGPHNCRMG